MKLKCDDGIVRNFAVARSDGDYLPDGSRQGWRSSPAKCLECGKEFGVHDTHVLKPDFLAHKCATEQRLHLTDETGR